MKILILCQIFYPDPSSVGQHMYDLAHGLIKKKNQVTVVASRNDSNKFSKTYKKEEKFKGINIIRYRNLIGNKKNMVNRFINQITFSLQILYAGLFFKYDKLILTTNPIFSPVIGSIIYFIRRKKIYFWVMDINPDEAIAAGVINKNLLTKMFDFFNSYILNKSIKVFTLDKYMKRTLIKKNKHSDIEIIEPWPHESSINEKIRENFFIKKHDLKNKFVLMYSGNQTFINPIDSILKIAKSLKNNNSIKFMFIGNGNANNKIVKFKKDYLLDNLIILDYLPLDQIKFSLSAANIHFVTLGNRMRGIIHPCKIYNLIILKKPIIYFGPKNSHIDDIIKKFKIGWTFKHSETSNCKKLILRQFKLHKNKKSKFKNILNPFIQHQLIDKMIRQILG